MRWQNIFLASFFIFGFGCAKMIAKTGLITTAELTGELGKELQKYDLPYVVGKGMPSNILLLETALSVDPENWKILSTLAQLYCVWGFGFVEDENLEEAKKLYKKGYEYGKLALYYKNGDFRKKLDENAPPEELAKTIKEDDIEPAFWMTICLGYWISASKGSPEAVAEISRMRAFIDRLIELDPDFFYGGPILLKATYYATAPTILGGGPVKAKIWFKKAFEVAQDSLLPYFVYARFYATLLKDRTEKEVYLEEISRVTQKIEQYKKNLQTVQDEKIKQGLEKRIKELEEYLDEIKKNEELFTDKTGVQIFEETVEYILNYKTKEGSYSMLSNEIAKMKVKRLLEMKDELFW